MNKNITKIGIIGGMGPFASSHFHQLLLQRLTGKPVLPQIFMDTISIEDFTVDTSKIPPALKVLSKTINTFNKSGVTLIVMPCNTAHILHPQLSQLTNADFPNLVDLVTTFVGDHQPRRVLLLASPNTVKSKIYTSRLRNKSIKVTVPLLSDQFHIEKAIKNLIHGIILDSDIDQINKIISKHIPKIDAVILGCTELSLISHRLIDVKKFDSLEILADHVISVVKC